VKDEEKGERDEREDEIFGPRGGREKKGKEEGALPFFILNYFFKKVELI